MNERAKRAKSLTGFVTHIVGLIFNASILVMAIPQSNTVVRFFFCEGAHRLIKILRLIVRLPTLSYPAYFCRSICFSLSVPLFVCPALCLSLSLSVPLAACRQWCLYYSLSVCLSFCLSVCLSVSIFYKIVCFKGGPKLSQG